MRSFNPVDVCLALEGLPTLSAAILVPGYEGSNTTWPGLYRIGTMTPQPSKGWLRLGAGPVNLFDTVPRSSPGVLRGYCYPGLTRGRGQLGSPRAG